MGLPRAVTLREVGTREGFQTIPKIIPTEKKIELIAAIGRTGVKHIEIASFVRPDKLPQMADAEDIVKNFERISGISYTALYLNGEGFDRAERTKRLDNQGWIPFAASETFLKKNNNLTLQEGINKIPEWLKKFDSVNKKLHGIMLSTAFGCNYEGTISAKTVSMLVQRLLDKVESGGSTLKELCLADTVGRGNPEGIKALICELRSNFPNLYLTLHLHDTRGTGMANVYAGLSEGIECFDCSVGGLGGCPFTPGAAGNVCTEDVAYMCEEMGIATSVNLELYVEAAKLASKIVGFELPGKLHKAWR